MSSKCKSKSYKHEEQGSPLSSKSRFWGVCCESGKKYSQVVAQRFHITMAALEPSASDDEDSYVSLMVERGGAEYLLCSLKHNAIVQVNLNLIFEKGENVTFFLRGQGTVHLSGYHESSYADGEISSNTTESPMTEIKKAKKLEVEVEDGGSVSKSSADKNANTSKKDSKNAYPKFFAIPSTSKGIIFKHSEDEDDDEDDESSEEDVVKSSTPRGERKTSLLSNDLVQTLTENIDSDEDDDDDADFNVFDEEEGSEDDEEAESEEDDDDDSDDDYSSGEEIVDRAMEAKKRKRDSDAANSLKRLKKDKSLDASNKSVQSFEVEDEQDSSEEEESENELCRTMPLPKMSYKKQEGEMSNKKKSNDIQKKHFDNNFAVKNMKPIEEVEFEDIRLGYGPCAKQGKILHVFYTGRLSDGKIFDQITHGKPFGFKLGSGQVMKGWEVGLEGMKVGGKRRIKVPPHLGYGTKPINGVPPNSTLTFIIDLKSVN